MADIELDHKKQQAAYAAKNRRKAKALRRPERMMRVYLGKLTPDCDVEARSRDAVELVRSVAVLVLLDEGYDLAQIRDNLASMTSK